MHLSDSFFWNLHQEFQLFVHAIRTGGLCKPFEMDHAINQIITIWFMDHLCTLKWPIVICQFRFIDGTLDVSKNIETVLRIGFFFSKEKHLEHNGTFEQTWGEHLIKKKIIFYSWSWCKKLASRWQYGILSEQKNKSIVINVKTFYFIESSAFSFPIFCSPFYSSNCEKKKTSLPYHNVILISFGL